MIETDAEKQVEKLLDLLISETHGYYGPYGVKVSHQKQEILAIVSNQASEIEHLHYELAICRGAAAQTQEEKASHD